MGAIVQSVCRAPLMQQPLHMAAGAVTMRLYICIAHRLPPAAPWQMLQQ